jgi:hypothetical protein
VLINNESIFIKILTILKTIQNNKNLEEITKSFYQHVENYYEYYLLSELKIIE